MSDKKGLDKNGKSSFRDPKVSAAVPIRVKDPVWILEITLVTCPRKKADVFSVDPESSVED